MGEVSGAALLCGADLLFHNLHETVIVPRLGSRQAAFQRGDFGGKRFDFHPFERTHRQALIKLPASALGQELHAILTKKATVSDSYPLGKMNSPVFASNVADY